MRPLRFIVLPERFAIHRLPPDWPLDYRRLAAAGWYSVTRTSDELSVVAPEGITFDAGDRRPGWSCLQIGEVLDFSLVGVLAGVAKLLAEADISIFTLSTYNTDYLFVPTADLAAAQRALAAAGHSVAGAA
jgi:hypothetical protein